MTILPPAQYDVPPAVPVVEYVLTLEEVHRMCGRNDARGCSGWKGGKCYIFRIDHPYVARHERAHCNGWPGHHPGGWYDLGAE